MKNRKEKNCPPLLELWQFTARTLFFLLFNLLPEQLKICAIVTTGGCGPASELSDPLDDEPAPQVSMHLCEVPQWLKNRTVCQRDWTALFLSLLFSYNVP